MVDDVWRERAERAEDALLELRRLTESVYDPVHPLGARLLVAEVVGRLREAERERGGDELVGADREVVGRG